MGIKKVIARLNQAFKKHGFRILLKKIIQKIWAVILVKYRLQFNNQNIVCIFDGKPPDIKLPNNVSIKSYNTLDEIPEDILVTIKKELGYGDVPQFIQYEFSQNSKLWLLFFEKNYASQLFTRSGKFYKQWFVPLKSNDFLILAAGTLIRYQQKGLYPLLIKYILTEELKEDGRAFIDCKVWNKAAIQAQNKVGFKKIGIMKNYW